MTNNLLLSDGSPSDTLQQTLVASLPAVVVEDEANVMTFKDIFLKMCRLGWPTALSYTLSMQMVILSILYRQINTGEEGQAAASLISTYISVFVVLSLSPIFATSIHSGYLFGLLERPETPDEDLSHHEISEQITETYRSTLIMAQSVSVPISVLFLYYSDSVLEKLFKQDVKVSRDVQHITRLYAPAMPFLMARLSAEMIMLGKGKNTPPMIMGGISFVLSTLISTSLSLGLFGLPKYGASAFIIGADIEALVSAVAFTTYLCCQKDFSPYQFLNLSKPLTHFKNVFSTILKLGASFPIPYFIEFGMNWGAMMMAANSGITSQSKMGVMMQYALSVQLISTAFGQCVSQEISRKIGSGDNRNARRVSIYGLLSTATCIAPIPLACALVPQFQDKDKETQVLAILMAIGFMCDVFRYNMLQQLRALNDPNRSALISCLCLMMGTGLSAILTTQTNLGVVGDAMGYSLGMLCAAIVLCVRWLLRVNSLQNKNNTVYNPQFFTNSSQHNEATSSVAPQFS